MLQEQRMTPAGCPKPRAAAHLDVLDGLRGLAILLVVWFHYWQLSWLGPHFSVFGRAASFDFIPASGYLGVELFFFISGFCLFYPYAKHKHENGPWQTWSQYLYRRCVKILPSYILAIVLIVAVFDVGIRGLAQYWRHLWTHVLFIHNFFPDTYSSINGVFWSLGVEIQFYVLFPVICLLFIRWPLPVYAVISVFSMWYRVYIARPHVEAMSFYMNQLPGFLDLFRWQPT
jgi:peptidoglycan/LPS O-acetylase OafA/YrhL